MMKVDSRITAEIENLVENGKNLHNIALASGSGVGGEELVNITAWVARLGQIIRKIYGINSQYFDSYSKALETDGFYNLHSNHYKHLTQMLGVAQAIKHEISQGLLVDFKALIEAEVFADFLEMGEYLLNKNYKDAAAVIIGSVLEDGMRKLCERSSLPITTETGKPLTIEPLNSQLAKAEVYSKLVQKQITTWAHIRNNAAHGKYEEYNIEQVRMMLIFVQDFARNELLRT